MPDHHALCQLIPIIPAPSEFMHHGSQEKRGIRDASCQHDIRARLQSLDQRLRAKVGAGKEQALTHSSYVLSCIHMRQRDACRLELVKTFQYGIAQHNTDLQLDTEFLVDPRFIEECKQYFPRSHRVQPTRIQNEFDAARNGQREQLGQHWYEITRIAEVGIALAVLLQNRQRQFGQVIRCDILHIAALNAGLDRAPRVAMKTKAPGNTDGFHGYCHPLMPSSSLAISNWRISVVPAPISPSRALRHKRSTSKSVR